MRISDWSSDVCSSDLYLAGSDGDQLALAVRFLVMQAADHAAARAREIGLHRGNAEAVVEIARRIPQLLDEAAVIEKTLHLDDEDIRQVGGDDAHGDCPPVSGRSTRPWPCPEQRRRSWPRSERHTTD